MPEAARTLVKSPPELWAEVSDPDALARHLAPFGEIRITRLEPEATVAWEGDRVRGTVDLSPAGWGTKVRVTAQDDAGPAPAPAPAEPEPSRHRPGVVALLVRLLGREAALEPAEPEPAPEPARRVDPAVLDEMLVALGSARHRPFSRG
jgi:hypothetical protein